MSAKVDCLRNSLTQQIADQSTLSLQQQQLKLLHQQTVDTCDESSREHMLIDDEVYGVIELPNNIVEIVSHPLFQRLKKILQLGLLPLALSPQSNHTRYDHCIGTYKSAQDLLNALDRNSNYEPKLPEWCRLAVEIAALLHDIGHGPFSHHWEAVCGEGFDHEQNGVLCVDLIFRDMMSPELVSLRDDNNGRGVQLIKALIIGKSELLTYPMLSHGYIFDIVHNSRCGLDVDKWDYIRRDNVPLRVLNEDEMQFDDVFHMARISPDGQRIEYRYDDYHLIYKLFVARWRLHISAYQLPLSLAFDKLLVKIINRCQPNLLNVRADSKDWLELNDENVLRLIANDPLSIYLQRPERWIQTDICDGQNPNCICVKRVKLGPGYDMQPDESYTLYGNKSKKRSIDRLLESTSINACYKLQ